METVTGWLEAGSPAAGYQTDDLSQEMALSSFDARHRLGRQLRCRSAVRRRPALWERGDGICRDVDQRMDAERRHHPAGGLSAGFTATPNLIGSGYGLRPNVDPNCDKKVDGSATDRLNMWFNTACFSVPNAGFVAADPATNPGLRWQLGMRRARIPTCAGTASTTGTSPSPNARASVAASISRYAPRRSICSTACSSGRRTPR